MPLNDSTVMQLAQDIAACKAYAEEASRNTRRIDDQLTRMNGKFGEHEKLDDTRFAVVSDKISQVEQEIASRKGGVATAVWLVGILVVLSEVIIKVFV